MTSDARSRLAVAALALAAIASGLAAACLDTDPIDFTPPDAAPPPVVEDAAADGADADLRGRCQRCVESPPDAGGCDDLLAKCLADPHCAATYACSLRSRCLTRGSRRDIVNCGLPCAEEAGITSQDDPAIPLVLEVVDCAAVGPCAATCADGG